MLRDLNLNLLRHLNALLEARTVSGAARLLLLSQPTVSSALSQLRAVFNDPLLSRHGNVSSLTPLGEDLRPAAAAALRAAERVFEMADHFHPSSSTRAFTVICPDYWTALLGARVTRQLQAEGWTGEMRFVRPEPGLFTVPDARLAAVDAAVLPHGAIRGYPHADLLNARWVLLMDRTHVLASADEIRPVDLGRFPWVVVRSAPGSTAVGDDVLGVRDLEQHGVVVRPDVVVDSQLAAPSLLRGTSRLLLAQESRQPRTLLEGLVERPCPLPLRTLHLALWWHNTHTGDPAHHWFRTTARAAIDGLDE